METIISGLAGFVAMLIFLWVWNDVAERIPPKLKLESAPLGAKDFGAWFKIEDFWLEEYRVDYSDEWALGPRFSLVGDGNIRFEKENHDGRILITISGFRDAYTRNTKIGWTKLNLERKTKGKLVAEVQLSLGPVEARDILAELRENSLTTASVHGWETDKGIIAISGICLEH